MKVHHISDTPPPSAEPNQRVGDYVIRTTSEDGVWFRITLGKICPKTGTSWTPVPEVREEILAEAKVLNGVRFEVKEVKLMRFDSAAFMSFMMAVTERVIR